MTDGMVYSATALDGWYPDLLNTLRTKGAERISRGGKTKELTAFTLRIANPSHCVVARAGFSREFMDLEIEMLLAGVYHGDLVADVTPKAAELVTPLTAYGPRVVTQLREVERELRGSPDSRRAVVYVGRPGDLANATQLAEKTAGEMPCTALWQFLVRDGALEMVVYMRSWDAVWGLTYDVPCFVSVQMALSHALGLKMGVYHHVAGSFHLYERHWDVDAWENHRELDIPWLKPTIFETQKYARGLLAARAQELVKEPA